MNRPSTIDTTISADTRPRVYRNGEWVPAPDFNCPAANSPPAPLVSGPVLRSIDYAAQAVGEAADQVKATAKNLDETITLFRGQAEAIVAYLEKLIGLSAK
jgi:hypothetical protein